MSSAISTQPFPYRLTISLPLPSYRLANAAKRSLEVDKELSSSVSRQISLASITREGEKADSLSNGNLEGSDSDSDVVKQDEPTLLITEYSAATNRMLRVAVNGFMESMGVVLGVMAELDIDVLEHESGYGVDRP
ncbi:EKC/KEOPS complex, subunit Pcc1 [Ascosphaera apis ARSEF 7405]|uniref:EKC/KEOPS complex, subunit Pcc1 n=1 Tax=Ascosphaera apis ARSEF 7405 TaxID=392613 RepID=A0A167VJH3_9EURO|nr:EKC/KEOPS complex, subunit Pcc1 [Ascosphaera apis ARSEF 7405]